jgi:Ca2+-binding RTX toxin-like protein
MSGGFGDDRFVPGPGTDSMFGQAGNDVFFARNSKRDIVNGGTGTSDSATVDRVDSVSSVEKIYR